MPRSITPLSRHSSYMLAFLLGIFVLASLNPALASTSPRSNRVSSSQPSSRDVRLENRTFSVMWYRVRSSGTWSEWRKLLSGASARYDKYTSMTIDISNTGGERHKYSLDGGSTYKYYRPSPNQPARFALAGSDSQQATWPSPVPPAAAEFSTYDSASEMFAPLERFIDLCERRGADYKLSLKDLAVQCYIAQEQAGSIPDDLRYLKGFTWFFGYLIDKKNDDVILLGVKDSTKPPIDLDCLSTAISSAHFDLTPFCSLESDPNPKYQKSVVGGVPWDTKWAEIMIDADYAMKKVGQGSLDPHIPGLQSHFDGVVEWARRTHASNTQFENRWWFNFQGNESRSRTTRSGDLAIIYRNPMVVSTETKMDGKYGTGVVDPVSLEFANNFTNNMNELGMHYPSIAELAAIYRLYDVFFHLKHVGHASAPALKYWVDLYKRIYTGPPKVVPTLTRHKDIKWRDSNGTWTVPFSAWGGVMMRLNLPENPSDTAGDNADVINRILDE